jgi:hypothetical protein
VVVSVALVGEAVAQFHMQGSVVVVVVTAPTWNNKLSTIVCTLVKATGANVVVATAPTVGAAVVLDVYPCMTGQPQKRPVSVIIFTVTVVVVVVVVGAATFCGWKQRISTVTTMHADEPSQLDGELLQR